MSGKSITLGISTPTDEPTRGIVALPHDDYTAADLVPTRALVECIARIMQDMREPDPEIERVVNEQFWSLI